MANFLAAAVASLVGWAAASLFGKDSFWSLTFLLVLSSASFHFSRRFFNDLRPG